MSHLDYVEPILILMLAVDEFDWSYQYSLTLILLTQNEEKSEEKRHEIGSSGATVPRQFLNLGPREETKTENEVSNSSSEARTRSDSPQNNVSANGKRVGREESPESETQGWVPNKVAKPDSPPKPIDQATEATMRKARVSVRARSEAPMVSKLN